MFQLGTALPQALPTQRPFSSLSAQEQLSDGSIVSKAKLRAIPSRVLTQLHSFKFRLTTVDSREENPSPAGRGEHVLQLGTPPPPKKYILYAEIGCINCRSLSNLFSESAGKF